MKARVKDDMMVPQLREDGTFLLIQVKKDAVYPLISNDCGPVLISMSGIIFPKNKVLTES